MGYWSRLLAAWLCCGGIREDNDGNVEEVKETEGHVEKPLSPPVMESVLSMACHGNVMGQERYVFVAVKNNLLNSNVRVTQLARPCAVLLVFHDISSGASVGEILTKVENAASESGALKVVLILMYADFCGHEFAGFQASGRQRLGEKSWKKLEGSVSLVVDMVYSERDAALYDCLQNTYSLQQVVQYLKHVVRDQNAMLTGDSFTISRAIQLSTPSKRDVGPLKLSESPVPSNLIPAGSIHQSSSAGSHTGSSSQGSFHNVQSPQGSPLGIHSEGAKTAKPLQIPRPSSSRKAVRVKRDCMTPSRYAASRRSKADARKRAMTWGGWDLPKQFRGSSKNKKGRTTPKPVDMKCKSRKNEIRAIASGYPSNAPSGVKSACYQFEKCGVKSGQVWQAHHPPVFDGNCFLEIVPK